MRIQDIAIEIADGLSPLPNHWEGKCSIIEMREGGSKQWRQMEWIGWYFEYKCGELLGGFIKIPGPRYGNVGFDGFELIPWDFKAHSMVNPQGKPQSKVIVNDLEAIHRATSEYGSIGLVVAQGIPIYDGTRRSFQRWHDQYKGKRSKYVEERIQRGAPSRIRKASFTLKYIEIFDLRLEALEKAEGFQQDFRNADGSPRRVKVMIDLRKVQDYIIRRVEFP